MARKRNQKCLACSNDAEALGLCPACYQSARYAIKKGTVTEERLVELGLMLPRHSKPQSPFREALANLLAVKDARCSGNANV